MDLLDLAFLHAACLEAERAGLFISEQRRMYDGCIVQQTWLDPIFTYCGAGA